MRRLVLGLNAATVLLVVAGIALLIVPLPAPAGRVTDSLASVAPTESVVPTVVADVGAADRVVKTDIFSPRRGPPARRYAFGETSEPAEASSSDMTPAAALAGEPLDSTTASTASDAVPHLYGTMMGPNDATALLRLDANVSEPRLYRVGDRAAGYRVAEITDRTVSLVGPHGRLVLRLIKREQ